MKNKKRSFGYIRSSYTIESIPLLLTAAVIGICMGIFFIFSQRVNKPIERESALFYSGEFQKYESKRNSCEIYFKDGSSYSVYPHTEKKEFRDKMQSLDIGEKLYIYVNPNNDCVIEIKTETEEILNFEKSQKAIDAYDNGYIAIGIFACSAGILLIIYALLLANHRRKEKECSAHKNIDPNQDSQVIRYADPDTKFRVLLEAEAHGYKICYRRVKFVNELTVNEMVYDEKKAVIEFEHRLQAVINGHIIEAGLNKNDYSYIKFDGKTIRQKKRII